MRNLTVLHHSIRGLKEAEAGCPELQEALNKQFICNNDPDSDTIFVLEENHLFVITCKQDIEIAIEKNIEVQGNCRPVGVEYWSDNAVLYCAYSSGELVKVTPEWPFDQEVVVNIEEGIKCIKLSPDQEILVLVTGSDNVMTMMSNLQVLSKVNLNVDQFGEKQFITAGWGAKETQFHGTEGKAAAKAKPVITGRTDSDTGDVSVTWRGDGTLFAVTFLNQGDNARRFRVFNREGVLQWTSELTSGLEENLSWKPSGNLLASTQRLPNKHVTALFEKNGLKHREFSLPFLPNEIHVKKITWSPDSEILTIWGQRYNQKETFLQLWSENNYHWYLKQTIPFKEENPLVFFNWSTIPRAKKRLIVLTRENFMVYTFKWSINRTRGLSDDDKAVVGVADGDKVLLTAFKMGIVPPPMSHYSLQISGTSNGCFFAPLCSNDTPHWLDSNCLFVHVENNQLALYVHQKEGLLGYRHAKTFDLEWLVPKIGDESLGYTMHHFVWVKADGILCSVTVEGRSYLCVLQIENLNVEKGTGRLVVSDALMMDGYIHHIVPTTDPNEAYLILDSGVLKYTHGEGIIPTEIILPEQCDHVEAVRIGMRHVLVALGSRNRLFLDGAEVANNITSICIHSEFLLLTTLQHTLVTVRMNELGFSKFSTSTLSIKSWGTDIDESTGLSLRRMERGGSLVNALRKDDRAVLQMPRGNLETVQPRSMSLHIIKTHLVSLNYFTVFDIMRKQRINLNLIHDHNPRVFMSTAEKFIDDIKNPCWLNYFISELVEEDVTDTIYRTCYTKEENAARRDEFEKPDGRKVERICQHLRQIMEKKADKRNLVQPILTCLVKNKQVSGLEAALQKVKEFKSKEGTKEGRQQSADEALKYLQYLVDINVLYDIALGMYDLDLAKFVASKSQKDPKEYIPYLNGLAELEENYRKFKINKDLKRYEPALEYIAHRLDKFDECIDLIVNHNLFVKAVKIFPRDTYEYRKVTGIAGEYFWRNKKYREAALMYHRSGNLERAFEFYKISGSWQDAIIITTEMDLNPGEKNKMYKILVRQMIEDRRFRDAAEISLAYLKNEEDAVSLMCRGKEWREASRIAHTHARLDLIETEVKPGVVEHAAWLLSKISENREEFLKYKKRLLIVRSEIAKREAEDALAEEEDGPGEVSDLLSDTSSIAGSNTSLSSGSSRSSGRSYRSSKNRRKQEKKVLSIKEGSVYEDLALVRALHTIISSTYEQREEVVAVNRILLSLYLDEMAEQLQHALVDIIEVIEKNRDEIWPRRDSEEEGQMNGHRRANPQKLLEAKFTYAPEVASVNWKLDVFSPVKRSPKL
ncbi:elongator complex protein 1 [Diachasmimorpha longicaudata]|uniref:elongator complex protein 1 n=1 Tax=Diachasmimorpha longicaudata TaxID=58733 RepID=UPI0030B8B183